MKVKTQTEQKLNIERCSVSAPEDTQTENDYELLRKASLKALEKINDLLDLEEALAPRDIKSLTSSLLDLKSQLNALSPRELREQAARLRQLERQIEESHDTSEAVEIEFVNVEGAQE